jgi:hypothetical protein
MRLFILLYFISSFNFVAAQEFQGTYIGDFLDSANRLTIIESNSSYLVTIKYFSDKAISFPSELFNEELNFNIPSSGNCIEVKGRLSDYGLEITYFANGSNQTASLEKLGEIKKIQDKASNNIIGKWIQLGTYDSKGNSTKADFSNKSYYREFLRDGRMIIDPRLFRDDAQKHGLPFSYQDIPNFRWKVEGSTILITATPNQIGFSEEFMIKGDSLILKNDMGFKTYFIKHKNSKSN